jgi:hypothetical protein
MTIRDAKPQPEEEDETLTSAEGARISDEEETEDSIEEADDGSFPASDAPAW